MLALLLVPFCGDVLQDPVFPETCVLRDVQKPFFRRRPSTPTSWPGRWLDRPVRPFEERQVDSLGIEDLVTSPGSPWQNGYVERVIGTIRRECLDHVIVFNERHLLRALGSYVEYYNRTRTHLGLEKDAPFSRPVDGGAGEIRSVPEVGGLHHRYTRMAA